VSGSAAPEGSSSRAGRRGRPHWFEALADFVGPAYLRYSFTKGTDQEVGFLVDAMGLEPGARVLDVGCGPGRHAQALAARGCRVVGVDIAERFVQLAADGAPPGACFVRGDARFLPVRPAFDAVISLCQGGFGLPADPSAPDDAQVLRAMAGALRPGGRLALTAFSSYFLVRHLEDSDSFEPSTGVNLEHTTVKDGEGGEAGFDLWTACYTPRELRLLAASVGLEVLARWSVTPGAYDRRPPDLEHPELLLLGERVASSELPEGPQVGGGSSPERRRP
jgi:SAM-dependent methyltransferase